MNPVGNFRFLSLCLAAALAAGCNGMFGSSSDSGGGVSSADPYYGNCLANGAPCGGGAICCPGSICKGGRCSLSATCVGVSGHCSSSADCCGISECLDGVCDSGACRAIGAHCAASADCCGTLTCQSGICK